MLPRQIAGEMTADGSSDDFRHLANVVLNNLENQQDWTELQVHDGEFLLPDGPVDDQASDDDASVGGGVGAAKPGASAPLCHRRSRCPRILLSGLPPRRIYIHPDEQIDILRAERELGHGHRIPQPPEYEWVLPMHLAETPSISQFAAIFDSIDAHPVPTTDATADTADADTNTDFDTHATSQDQQWKKWRGAKRGKRLLLAIVQDDSTVVYYVMHDGIVKPRQN